MLTGFECRAIRSQCFFATGRGDTDFMSIVSVRRVAVIDVEFNCWQCSYPAVVIHPDIVILPAAINDLSSIHANPKAIRVTLMLGAIDAPVKHILLVADL